MRTKLEDWDRSQVREVGTIVRINGVERAHSFVHWRQEISSTLPVQVSSAGKFGYRRGDILWFRPGIRTRFPSPWWENTEEDWRPEIADEVTVDAVDGKGNVVRVFTGIIDSVAGDSDAGMTSRIVDNIDYFDKTVRVQALTNIGIPWKADGSIRMLAPSNAWVIDDIARQCGFLSTPPRPPDHIVDAPLQGTTYLYAETGGGFSNAQTAKSHALTDLGDGSDRTKRNPGFWEGGAGMALRDADLEYHPYTGTGSKSPAQIRLSFMVGPKHQDLATVWAERTDGYYEILIVTANREVWVGSETATQPYTERYCFTLPVTQGEWSIVSAIFRNGSVTAVSSHNQTFNGTLATKTGTIRSISVNSGYQAAIAGVQASDPGTSGGHLAVTFKPQMSTGYGWHSYVQKITPSIRDRHARTVINEFSESMLAPVWIDGKGVLRVEGANHLVSQNSITVESTQDTISQMEWSYEIKDIRNPVNVEWQEILTHMQLSPTNNDVITLNEGSGNQAPAGQRVVIEDFIEVPEDEEWINFNWVIQAIDHIFNQKNTAQIALFNNGENSWVGAMQANDQNTESWNGSRPEDVANTYKFEKITPWVYKATYTLDKGTMMKVPEISTVNRRFWGMKLPILRAPGKVMRKEALKTMESVSQDRIMLRASEVVHTMGQWNTNGGLAEMICEWVFSQVTVIRPTISNMVIRFDPRVEVGRVILLESRQLHGVSVRGLVTEMDHKPDQDTTTVTVSVISTSTSKLASYEELKIAWEGANYSTLKNAWASIEGTYDKLQAEPTRKNF